MIKHWIRYYEKDFTEKYNCVLSTTDNQLKTLAYLDLLKKSCELMKYYFSYQGLFQNEYRDLVKTAFYTELIEDGDIWINAISLLEVYEKHGLSLIKTIVNTEIETNFFILDKLNNKFKSLLEAYE